MQVLKALDIAVCANDAAVGSLWVALLPRRPIVMGLMATGPIQTKTWATLLDTSDPQP
jgi:hypothetical protein